MNHNNFILSPVSDILKDMISATSGIGDGIETYPLCDYIMQSTFLKMTGAQEQKMKCIVWELATYDYEYRYFRFTQKPLGECSSYNDKQKIYKDLIDQIEKYGIKKFDINSINKNLLLNQTTPLIRDTFFNTNLSVWAERSFREYTSIWSVISHDYFATKDNLFSNTAGISGNPYSLIEMYNNHLYKHRNRIAHNTLSYQQNLPTLNMLIKEEHKFNNYFIYFSILILIDNIIMNLYKRYLLDIDNLLI